DELARAGGATVVFEPINQIARARNTGAAAATGDWLIFVDADSKPSRELFAEVAEHRFSGSFIFCNAEAFWSVGGFSNELFVAEEIDLSKRLNRLAREKGKKVVILHRHPLLTSARRLHFYSRREQLPFLGKTILKGGRFSRDREHCHPWYDGRR